jgi:CheY-like chemotaxis protein
MYDDDESRVFEPGIMDLKKEFGQIIKGRRLALRYSQEVLAERADLHRTYVTDIERGTRNLTLESISRLSNALGVSIRELFPTEIFGRPDGASASPARSTDPVELLLVEDNAKDAELTLAAFKEARLTNRVVVVRDGAAALDYIFCRGEHQHRHMDQPPEAVLLDLNLPKVSGLEVLRALKNDQRTSSIKVIVLSASRRDDDVSEAIRLGALGYIVKPVDFRNFSQVTPKLDFSWALIRQAASMEAAQVSARKTV